MLDRINAAAQEAPKPVSATGGKDSPELADMKKQVAEATDYAAHAHVMAFGEPKTEGAGNALKDVLAQSDKEGAQDTELAKAVDAAVRCGAIRGFD